MLLKRLFDALLVWHHGRRRGDAGIPRVVFDLRQGSVTYVTTLLR